VERLLDDWFELHGDRQHGDDAALVAGLGRFRDRTIVLLGNQKGRDVKERTRRNFGMAYPEGYGKAMRAMELADRHGFPVVSLVDIPGAYPGVTAEQHGQGGAIARSQSLMARLGIPVVTCVIGEGGSGGAIATALADRVLMQENAIYTVISPEGCAAILWRDAGEARKAAAAFKPDAPHCLELGVIDMIVPEPGEGAPHRLRRGGAAAGRRAGRVAGAARDAGCRRPAPAAARAVPHNRTSACNPLEIVA
jgi:acetyl-CoA carboxylase carboxyl transferase subunit alpha